MTLQTTLSRTPGSALLENQPTVLYVINVDWFFASHFLPLAAEARRRGYRVLVACEITDVHAAFESAGIQFVPLPLSRSDRRLARVWRAARQVAVIVQRERVTIVHAIGLEGILVAVLAGRRTTLQRLVLAPTGLGYGSVEPGVSRLVHSAVRRALRLGAGRSARWIFENNDDPRRFGITPGKSTHCLIVGGAGVDTQAFAPTPLPPTSPLKVALVARMIRSKGPDLAVEAVCALRRKSIAVELTLVGDPDPFNPRSFSPAEIAAWGGRDGIHCVGRQSDIARVWARHHVALGPSRGGEGLPKALLEAAACGRAIVTTDVPGCRDVVHDGAEGILVPPDDVAAIAAALERLATNPDLVGAMGTAARARVLAHHADTRIAQDVWNFSEKALHQIRDPFSRGEGGRGAVG